MTLPIKKACWGWVGVDGTGVTHYFAACASLPGWTSQPIYGTGYSYPSDNGVNITGNGGYGVVPTSITPLKSRNDLSAWLGSYTLEGGCNGCLYSGNCPEGQCECHSDSYPGYCCQDCNAVAAQIQAMNYELLSKGGGVQSI